MKKLLILFLLALAGTSSAQVKMREVLVQMPDSLVPFLNSNARLDFIDYIDSKMKAEVSNSLDGRSQLVKLTDSYALLELSQASQLEMRLLDTSEPVDSANQLICVVQTYGTDIRESVVSFYSVHWRPLPADRRIAPHADMFVATLGEQEATISIRPERRLDAPANEEQEELVESSTILKWDGRMFNEH